MKRGVVAIALLLLFGLAALFTIYTNSQESAMVELELQQSRYRGNKTRTRWASVSLCWGENAQVYGKENFPYSEAAFYSSMLWHNQTEGKVGVILTIVSARDRTEDAKLDSYVRRMEEVPGVTVVLQENLIGNCVLQSQVTRMYAWQNSFVKMDDVIVMADADLFLVGKPVMEMLEQPSRVWLGEYSHTQSTGGSFPMALTAMTAQDWSENLDFSTREGGGPTGMEDVVTHFKKLNGGTGWGEWEVDQVILSNVLLRPDRQLCSLPKRNGLWTRLKIAPHEFNDAGLCFHGDLMNCNRGSPHTRTPCPWWHFLPTDKADYLEKVYNSILRLGRVEHIELNFPNFLSIFKRG